MNLNEAKELLKKAGYRLSESSYDDDYERYLENRKESNKNFFVFAQKVNNTVEAFNAKLPEYYNRLYTKYNIDEDKMDRQTYAEFTKEIDQVYKTDEIIGELNYEDGTDLVSDWFARHGADIEAIFEKYGTP